jgi:hypothetical protein
MALFRSHRLLGQMHLGSIPHAQSPAGLVAVFLFPLASPEWLRLQACVTIPSWFWLFMVLVL